MADFIIRPLETHQDFLMCEDLQKAVWGMEERQIVPLVELTSTAKARGVVAGAFEPDGFMAGFVFGFWGLGDDEKVYHYSRMVGVHPSRRGQKVAEKLKRYQRDAVVARGVELCRWTFDPLEGENASLNVAKLGVTASEYIENFYGLKNDEVNRGLPTDRYFVRWDLSSPRVAGRMAGRRPALDAGRLLTVHPSVLSAVPLGPDLAASTEPALDTEALELIMEIPPSIRALKAAAPQEAFHWRMRCRLVSQTLFERGYRVEEFVSQEVDGLRRSLYLFKKSPP